MNYWVVDTSHIRITQAIRRTIRQAFPESELFTVESAVVVSWEGIGYWQNGTDKASNMPSRSSKRESFVAKFQEVIQLYFSSVNEQSNMSLSFDLIVVSIYILLLVGSLKYS